MLQDATIVLSWATVCTIGSIAQEHAAENRPLATEAFAIGQGQSNTKMSLSPAYALVHSNRIYW